MKEGTYIVEPFYCLLPGVGVTEGIGGLVNLPIKRNGRKLKLEEGKEELCDASSCQAPQAHNCQTPNKELSWIQCDCSQCKKWYHLQCVGIEESIQGLPRKWFCGCSKFTREKIMR